MSADRGMDFVMLDDRSMVLSFGLVAAVVQHGIAVFVLESRSA
jgi:hypothetical protein